jgi:hypothetical protein
MAGEIVMREAREHGVRVLAVDSEHSAISQVTEAIVRIELHDVPEDWVPADGNHGFRTVLGFLSQSSALPTA